MYTDRDSLQAINDIVRHCLSERINVGFTEDSWEQASPPIRFGGLGIRSVVKLALPRFLSSVHKTHELVADLLRPSGTISDLENHSDAHEDFRERYGVELPTGGSTLRQREWDSLVCQLARAVVTVSCSLIAKGYSWDSTCVDTFSASAVMDSAISPGSAAN